MKDLGEASLLLGVKITHTDNGFTLSQEHYINTLAREYDLEKYSPANTPLKPNLQLNNATKEEEAEFAKLNINYRSAIGALNYISTNTRPDITFAVSHLSRFLEKPGITHWTACLQVLRYLYHTRGLSLHYSREGKKGIEAYADADWGNSVVDRRSTSGYIVTVNDHLVSWRTKKQPTVSHSTTEAEYKALSDMTKEVEWLMQLLKEIDLNKENSTPQLFNDNKGAIDLALSNANHNGFKTKHMDIKYHYIRDLIRNSVINLKYIPTNSMAADFLTKDDQIILVSFALLKSLSFLKLSLLLRVVCYSVCYAKELPCCFSIVFS
ncbi:hypothetical protein O181_034926 [Austropuccinia psidii MF-1]|uniref:Reverse transcriptase Ty1/copia-type domain-containing protein n=1 Tax=Austropuccinia psidii MF-1 TaxID=1389203 RepID=A0A9Q3D1P5_9BASI|nr:hypothetical protein [Austropuccinia psidii MF-1]